MKKVTKKLALVLVAAMVMGMCLVGCGSVEKDVLGDWMVDTVNGTAIGEYAAAAGVAEDQMQMNFKIESKKVTQTGVNGSTEYEPKFRTDGVELHKDGTHQANLLWDKDAKVLSLDINGAKYVFKKGSYTFGSAAQPSGGEEGGAEQGGAEEGGAEQGGAEEGAEE